MPLKERAHNKETANSKRRAPLSASENQPWREQRQTHLAAIYQLARMQPGALTSRGVLQLQRAFGNRAVAQLFATTARQRPPRDENSTGLPDDLKAGIENLSGISLDDVKVRYNSTEPAKLEALAYTQGAEIHIAPGQEKHLPHEAWHVVQQKQGRVKPTVQPKGGAAINDDRGLEREADIMAAKAQGVPCHSSPALQHKHLMKNEGSTSQTHSSERKPVVQRTILGDVDPGELSKLSRQDFSGARAFADKAEVAQSMHRLSQLYAMKVYPITKEGLTVAQDEPVILVGHGGSGQFMSMDAQVLAEALVRWGVGPGMSVVLGGCETAQAHEAISMITKLTGKPPTVNKELAFTSPTSEFIINENISKKLYDERNSKLKGVDFAYVETDIKLLKGLTHNITEVNFDDTFTLIQQLCSRLGVSIKHLSSKYSIKSVAALNSAWEKAVTDKLKPSDKEAIARISRLQKVFSDYDYLEKVSKEIDAYLEGHRELVGQSNQQAITIHNEFIYDMEKQFNNQIERINYPVKVAKTGGPLPPILKKLMMLRKHLLTPKEEGGVGGYPEFYPYIRSFVLASDAIKEFVNLKGEVTKSLLE